MYLDQLNLVNYKNVAQADLSFSRKINCLIGHNGAGKTNVLDAIYFLSHGKSFYNTLDRDCVTHNADFCVMQGHYIMDDGRDEDIYCGIKVGKPKRFKRNKKDYKRLSEHVGLLPLVIISPADQSLIDGMSDERRRLIDNIISQRDHEYLHFLINYNTALQQRNSLLKQWAKDNVPQTAERDEMLDIWDQQLVDYGEQIHQRRAAFVETLTPIFQKYYSFVSNDKEQVSLGYNSSLNAEPLRDHLLRNRQRDLLLGHTSAGIHRDDLDMRLGDYPIRHVASQGQCKTFLIALKLAQFDFLKQKTGEVPLLLFDDIFDKLDAERVGQIIALAQQDNFGQIFITDTNREHIDELIDQLGEESRIFNVQAGTVIL